MATSNVAGLDALDPVANIGAGGETVIKDAVKRAVKLLAASDPRIVDLFVGQMAAEGFAVETGTKYTVESPTVKIEVIAELLGQSLIRAYIKVSGVWSKIGQFPLVVL